MQTPRQNRTPSPDGSPTSPRWSISRFRPFALSRFHCRTSAASPSRCCAVFADHHGQSRKRESAKEGLKCRRRDESVLPFPGGSVASPRWSVSRFRPFALSRSYCRTSAASPSRCCAVFAEHHGQSRKRESAKEGVKCRRRDRTVLHPPTDPQLLRAGLFRDFALSRSHCRTNAASPLAWIKWRYLVVFPFVTIVGLGGLPFSSRAVSDGTAGSAGAFAGTDSTARN